MTRLFDAATYIGRMPASTQGFPGVRELLESLDRLGIERALVNHTLAWQYAPFEGNLTLMDAIAGQPRLEPCWGVSPGTPLERYGGVAGLESALSENHVRAVRIFPRDHVFPIAGWMLDELLTMLNRRKMVLFVDLDQIFLQVGMYDYDANGLRNIAWLCQAYPEISVVLNRVGYRAYQNILALMENCENLYLDLSYFATHQGVEDIAQKYGIHRLVFGTSQPFVEAGGALARLQLAGVSDDGKESAGWRNLEHLLNRVEERKSPYLIEANFVTPGIEVIDAHCHLGPYYKFSIPTPDSDGMVSVMDTSGVRLAAISSHLAISGDWQRGNEVTSKAVEQFPDRFVGQVVISPNEPHLIEAELRHYILDGGFKAIKVVPDTHAQSILSKGYEPMWEFAAEYKTPVLSHTFHGSPYDDPQLFGEIALRYPDVQVLIVHAGALTAGFDKAIQLARQYPNLFLDVSGSYITSPWIKRMVDELGADKVVFSSDIPFIDQRYSLGRVLYAGLTPNQATMVLGRNARRLYQLDDLNPTH